MKVIGTVVLGLALLTWPAGCQKKVPGTCRESHECAAGESCLDGRCVARAKFPGEGPAAEPGTAAAPGARRAGAAAPTEPAQGAGPEPSAAPTGGPARLITPAEAAKPPPLPTPGVPYEPNRARRPYGQIAPDV